MKSSCYQFSSCICLILTFMLSESLVCEIPSELRNGSWIHKLPGQNDRTVNFGTTTLRSYTLSVQGTQISAYTCVLNQTLPSNKNILIFRSDEQYHDASTSRNNRIYLCMKMTKVSDVLFYFFLLNDEQTITSPSERVSTHTDDVTISSDSFESTFCQYDTNNPPDDARVLQRQGTSEQLPTCIRLCEPLNATCESVSNCPVVETVSHSTKTTSCGSSGYAITYKCETWYEVTAGNAELTCADNGTWLGTTPTCTLIICKDLKEVPNSTILPDIPTNNINETVTYHCNTGYEHTSGNITRTCKEDKQWSGLPPVCNPVNCGHLPFVPFTRNTTTGTHYLDNITYTCSQGYIHINGTLSRQCKSDRVWDGIEPTCSKLPSSPDASSNAFVAAAFAGSILFILPFVITCFD